MASHTIKTKRKNLSTFFNWLLKQRKIEYNPVIATDPISIVGKSREAFTKEEYDNLFNAAEDSNDRLFLQWLFSGIRPPAEYFAVDENKIDMENRVMEIYRKKMKTYGTIDILPGLYEEIALAKEENRPLRPFATEWKATKRFKYLCNKALIPKPKQIMYTCRHTIATILSCTPGWDPMKMKRQMGWTDINQSNTYVDDSKYTSWKYLRAEAPEIYKEEVNIFSRNELTEISENVKEILKILIAMNQH